MFTWTVGRNDLAQVSIRAVAPAKSGSRPTFTRVDDARVARLRERSRERGLTSASTLTVAFDDLVAVRSERCRERLSTSTGIFTDALLRACSATARTSETNREASGVMRSLRVPP
ncbi:Uncharacterised protein [Mycobacteroides abscessus subsp. abscessus]|nr:Uncharacterised protein [Mycobacteroides abscessus subsp. abscessus]